MYCHVQYLDPCTSVTLDLMKSYFNTFKSDLNVLRVQTRMHLNVHIIKNKSEYNLDLPKLRFRLAA